MRDTHLVHCHNESIGKRCGPIVSSVQPVQIMWNSMALLQMYVKALIVSLGY